jgi:hypothetical protein
LTRIIAQAGGSLPNAKIKEGLTEQEALDLEQSVIRSIGRHPHGPLVNMTDGGDGVTGWVPSVLTRSRIAAAKIGQTHSLETRRKMSVAGKGRPKASQHSEAIGTALRGKPKSEKHRAKLKVSARLRWARKTEHEAARAYFAGMTLQERDERAAKISATTRAAMSRVETREKMRAAWKVRKQREQVLQ